MSYITRNVILWPKTLYMYSLQYAEQEFSLFLITSKPSPKQTFRKVPLTGPYRSCKSVQSIKKSFTTDFFPKQNTTTLVQHSDYKQSQLNKG